MNETVTQHFQLKGNTESKDVEVNSRQIEIDRSFSTISHFSPTEHLMHHVT